MAAPKRKGTFKLKILGIFSFECDNTNVKEFILSIVVIVENPRILTPSRHGKVVPVGHFKLTPCGQCKLTPCKVR